MKAYTIGILVSLAVYLAVGTWAGRKVHHLEDYFVAGRQAPTFLILGTMVASLLSRCRGLRAPVPRRAPGCLGRVHGIHVLLRLARRRDQRHHDVPAVHGRGIRRPRIRGRRLRRLVLRLIVSGVALAFLMVAGYALPYGAATGEGAGELVLSLGCGVVLVGCGLLARWAVLRRL